MVLRRSIFFNDTATTEIYTLSLHDALPISRTKIRQWFTKERRDDAVEAGKEALTRAMRKAGLPLQRLLGGDALARSEEHTSELQSRQYLVCRLLLEKKKKTPLLSTEKIVSH